jgi:hypothetical protein
MKEKLTIEEIKKLLKEAEALALKDKMVFLIVDYSNQLI